MANAATIATLRATLMRRLLDADAYDQLAIASANFASREHFRRQAEEQRQEAEMMRDALLDIYAVTVGDIWLDRMTEVV